MFSSQAMKETVTINRPHIAEDFIEQLISQSQSHLESDITFTKEHLNTCLTKLSNDIMVRERQNYEKSVYHETCDQEKLLNQGFKTCPYMCTLVLC
jgi:hypothetical protein